MAGEDFVNEKLNLYISYDYLTAEQYSKIIHSTNEVYKSLTNCLIFGQINYLNSPNIVSYPIPLCLEEVYTGNSINTKFSFAKRFFPSVTLENNETINIILPQWTAILILSGLILSYGMDKYKDYLDIKIKQMELKEKDREELKAYAEQLDKINSLPNNSAISNIKQNVHLFQSQIYQQNIRQVNINDTTVHSK
jgi:hypothetical protein